MSQTTKTPKSVYVILAAGAILGAAATASILGGYAVGRAHAQKQNFSTRAIGNVSAENLAMMRNLDSSFAGLAEYIAPSVVTIQVSGGSGSDVFGRRMGSVQGEGSGVIIRSDGWILTNDHVAGGFDKVTVVLNDGRKFQGTVRRSEQSDLAVVKIDAKDLPTVQFADSNRVRPGQFAIAVGAPFGLESSVTIGHVSALSRQTSIGDNRMGQRDYPDLIQTDASINMGNSGGPLLDIEGRVIGINTAIYSGTGGSVGIGFAIPANQARLTADALIEKGKVVRGYLGVAPENIKEFQKKELGVSEGAYIGAFGDSSVASPARVAGIKEGDVITRIGGLAVTNQADLRNAMLRYSPGETVAVEFVRAKQRKTVNVKLIDPPKATARRVAPNSNGGGSPEEPLESPDGFQFPDFGDLMPKSGDGQAESKVPPVREGKARLGVNIGPIDETQRKQFHIPADVQGVVVAAVEPGSVAEKIGLKTGDVLQRIGSVDIRSMDDVTKAMADVKWGDTRTVKYARFGANMKFDQTVDVLFK